MKEKEFDSIKFLKEVKNSPTGAIETRRSGNHQFVDHKAYRNFNAGDRVKVFFEDKWLTGTVTKKYFKKKFPVPYIMIKTDKRIGNDTRGYLHGFGLEAPVENIFDVILANEKLSGKKIYFTDYKRKFNPAEEKILKKEDKDFNCPF